MRTDQYTEIPIDGFNGLYQRGPADEVPPDHAIVCTNINMNRKTNFGTRAGVGLSVTTSWVIKRQFLATFNNNAVYLLTMDTSGNIYSGSSGTPLVSFSGAIDFSAVNLFNKCFILPIYSSFSSSHVLYVWDGTNPPRPAAGLAPTGTMTSVFVGIFPGLSQGVHEFAVSFITNTGFTTQPGSILSVTFPDNAHTVTLSSIPTGPTGTVARQIFVTKTNDPTFYYYAATLINDNTTTSLTIPVFADTDLIVSADSLFDLLQTIPAATGFGGVDKYNGCLLVWGGENDLVRVSQSGSAESMDNVSGYIQLPSEFDGNRVKGSFQLRNTLYFTKFPGVFALNDNGSGDPSSWGPIQIVDGSLGSYDFGIATITGSIPSYSTQDVVIFADRAGLFAFNGVPSWPPLTWKIDDLWRNIYHGQEQLTTIAIDPFNQVLYCLISTINAASTPDTLIVGYYGNGLTATAIKWSVWSFPFTPCSIMMGNFNDGTGDYDYYLRIGSAAHNLYKMRDFNAMVAIFGNDNGTAINSKYQIAYQIPKSGNYNLYTAIRVRGSAVNTSGGNTIVNITLQPEDQQSTVTPPPWTFSPNPGLDYLRQINFQNEKMTVAFQSAAANGGFSIEKASVFCKPEFLARPG